MALSERKKDVRKTVLKVLFWVALVLVVYFFYTPLKFQVLRVLQLNSTVWAIYQVISREIVAKSLLGLFLTSFFGSLFFISIPVELVFLYYLGLDFAPWEVMVYAMLGNMLGMVCNYLFGFLLGPKILERWLKEKYEKWRRWTVKAGGFVLVFGNIVPLPIEFISIFIGGVRYPFFRFVLYTFLGKSIKFLALFFGFVYFSEELTFYWGEYLKPWLDHMYRAYARPFLGFF